MIALPLDSGAMTAAARRARRLAQELHVGQRDRYGAPVIDHVERVAGEVAGPAQAVALIHDVCERWAQRPEDVAARLGLSRAEAAALALLTRDPGESLADHARRVLACGDPAVAAIAVAVQRADVGDHLRHAAPDDGRHDEVAALLGVRP